MRRFVKIENSGTDLLGESFARALCLPVFLAVISPRKYNNQPLSRFSFIRDNILKTKLILILVSLSLATVCAAAPAPGNNKAATPKAVVTKAAVKENKKVKATTKKTAAVQKYKVRAGDSLYTIAKRHGMKLADLQRLNGLQSSRLKIGQILVVSGKAQKSRKVQPDEIVEESGQVISQIALPNEDGFFVDSLADAGVEPIARTYLSIPYRYGAQSRKSTDCSGFVQQVFHEFDIKLPRTAREQYHVGMKVDRSSLVSGDLLFFRTRARKNYPTHVGIYLGNGKMIHASSRQRKVVISDVNHPYYVKRYVGAKRTATFLPGEIDLEILARQVTGRTELTAEIDEEIETATILSAGLQQLLVLEAGYADEEEELGDDAGDDIDDEIEPDAEVIIPPLPQLGIIPDGTTTVSAIYQPER